MAFEFPVGLSLDTGGGVGGGGGEEGDRERWKSTLRSGVDTDRSISRASSRGDLTDGVSGAVVELGVEDIAAGEVVEPALR